MAIANKNGIVVSGDRRAMRYWPDPETGKPVFIRSYDRYQKIYRTKSNHCIGFCGCGTLSNGKDTGEAIRQGINIFKDDSTVAQEAYAIVKTLPQFIGNNPTEFLICGYDNGQPKVIACKINGELVQSDSGFITIGADQHIKDVVVESDEDIKKFSLEQSVAFLRKINRAVFDLMEVSNEEVLISRECDLLVLLPGESQWLIPLSRQKWVVM